MNTTNANPAQLSRMFRDIITNYPHVRKLFNLVNPKRITEEVVIDESISIQNKSVFSYGLIDKTVSECFNTLYPQENSCLRKIATREDLRTFFEYVYYYPCYEIPMEWMAHMRVNIRNLLIVHMIMERELRKRNNNTRVVEIPNYILYLHKYICEVEQKEELADINRQYHADLHTAPSAWKNLYNSA